VSKEDWQKWLWIKLKEKAGVVLADKTTCIRFIIRQLNEPVQQERIVTRLPHLHIFGVSVITHLHIHLLNELSKYISVSFYLLNPAPLVYWLDDKTEKQIARLGQLRKLQGKEVDQQEETGNTLLISWGKLIQETFGLLFENEEFLNVYNDAGVQKPSVDNDKTLLSKNSAGYIL
jgi:exodeoxyribonuclease V gamma subunit